jgi:hypothetical protein
MVNSRLEFERNCRLGHLLLIAAVAGGAWVGAGVAQPAPGPAGAQQAVGMAAKGVVKRAVSKPRGAEPAPGKQATPSAKPGPAEGARRDPFLLPSEPKGGPESAAEETGPLPAGKRGLVIGQLRLEGVVKQSDSKPMIAVVANSTNRAYFLRENDEVYNGVVSKITPDSIYFTENFKDASGQMSSREVIKRLGSGPGENR